MKHYGGGVSIYNGSDWKFAHAYVYDGTAWKTAIPWVYDGTAWKRVGGAETNMVYLLDSDGKYITDSSGGFILVREQ